MNTTQTPYTSVILLAGGTGSRMANPIPKQFLPLCNKPIINYSLELFLSLPEVSEVIIVVNPHYLDLFEEHQKSYDCPIKFAFPGPRRQDSVESGLAQVSEQSEYVCIHDAARPFITPELISQLFKDGYEHKAAALAVPLKFTVKAALPSGFVLATPDRSTLFEIQTPQIIQKKLLVEGFKVAHQKDLTVTDDVSLVELLELPVKLTAGSFSNIKITTPEDLIIANQLYGTV